MIPDYYVIIDNNHILPLKVVKEETYKGIPGRITTEIAKDNPNEHDIFNHKTYFKLSWRKHLDHSPIVFNNRYDAIKYALNYCQEKVKQAEKDLTNLKIREKILSECLEDLEQER